jgi:hypothetical protein
MTWVSNHRRRLQSATFWGYVACFGNYNTCNRPVCSLGCTARLPSPQKCRTRPPMPAYKTTTHVHTLLVSPQYIGTGISSQPFIKQIYDLVHLVVITAIPLSLQDAPGQRHRRVMSQRCPI